MKKQSSPKNILAISNDSMRGHPADTTIHSSRSNGLTNVKAALYWYVAPVAII
jgi:hypothetical protein